FNGEANAAMSDSSGNLLFYLGRTSYFEGGMNVYDKFNNLVSNGDSIKIELSATNGALILPKPHSDHVFYLFHKFLYETSTTCPNYSCFEFYTSIADYTSHNFTLIGKNTPILLEPSSEKLAAVRHANGEDWWLLMQATPKNTG